MAAVGVTSPAAPTTVAASISSSSTRCRVRLLPTRFTAAASFRAHCAAAAAHGGATAAEDPAAVAAAAAAAEGDPEAGTNVAAGAATSTRPPYSLISTANVQKAMRGLAITDADHYGRPGVTRLASTDEAHFCAFPRGNSSNLKFTPRRLCIERQSYSQKSTRTFALSRGDFSPVTQDVEGFLQNIVNMGFLFRLKLAWRIVFPAPIIKENTNANIAKQRLKMILFSDRCEVSDEAKKKIVENIVEALSEFVEIESRDNVQVDISTDAGLGTVYSVTVPVRRVKPEYQESEEQYRGKIVGVDFKDTGESSGNVDVTFDFFAPNENH